MLKNGSDISVFEMIILAVGVPISLFQVFWGWYTVSIRDKDWCMKRRRTFQRQYHQMMCQKFPYLKDGQKIYIWRYHRD